MTCPICDQKTANCDCTPRERAMYRELQEQGERPGTPFTLTDAEREAVDAAAATFDASDYPHANRKADTLRGLLERTR